MNNNNNDKKYIYLSVPPRQRTDANPEAKQLGQHVLDRFEQEKTRGGTVNDVIDNNILQEEQNMMNAYNRDNRNTNQVQLFGNQEHNTAMVEYSDRQGNVADEITSSDTPVAVSQNEREREQYYENMQPISAQPYFDVNHPDSNHSSSDSGVAGSLGEYHSPSDVGSSHSEQSSEQSSQTSASNFDSGIGSELSSDQESNHNNSDQMELDSENEAFASSPQEQEVQEQVQQEQVQEVEQQVEQQEQQKQEQEQAQETEESSNSNAESKVEESSSSNKRKRDDDSDEDDDGGHPSKRKEIDIDNYLIDTGIDPFDPD